MLSPADESRRADLGGDRQLDLGAPGGTRRDARMDLAAARLGRAQRHRRCAAAGGHPGDLGMREGDAGGGVRRRLVLLTGGVRPQATRPTTVATPVTQQQGEHDDADGRRDGHGPVGATVGVARSHRHSSPSPSLTPWWHASL